MALSTNPLARVRGTDSLARVRALNTMLIDRTLQVAQRPHDDADRIRLSENERAGILAVSAPALDRLRNFPIVTFEPSALKLADTIAMRPPKEIIDQKITHHWLRLADDLVRTESFGAALWLLGVRKADYSTWRDSMSDDRLFHIGHSAALEWSWRFQLPLDASLFSDPDTAIVQVKQLNLHLAWQYTKAYGGN